MSSTTNEAHSETTDEQTVSEFLSLFDDMPTLEDPADLERVAGTLLAALHTPGLPATVATTLLDAVAARRDENAAGALAVLAKLAPEPLAATARTQAARLAGDGIVSPAEDMAGTLAVVHAVRFPGDGVELVLAVLARPGSEAAQAAVFGIENQDTGGALIECELAPPAPLSEAREIFEGDEDVETQPIDAGELADKIVAAARRTVELEIELSASALMSLPVVSLALTGDPAGLPRPRMLAPADDDDPELVIDAEEDEEDFHRVMEMLLDELEQHARANYPPDSVIWAHGDFVASTMLQWKGDYDDGRLGNWTQGDLTEYLLDYFPRKVTAEEETLDAVPECIRAFLGFLQARGSLSGDPLEQLEHATEALRDEFLERARDSSRWGLAKSMFAGMQADGIDPTEPEAIVAWTEEFNARLREQRDALLGPAADRMAAAAGFTTGGPRAPKQKAERRKAQRQARKRNRRG